MPTTTLKRTDPASLGLIPVDDEEKKRKKKPQPQPDFSPEALGLIPLERAAPNPDDDFSPEALGLVPADQPAPRPAPPEDTDGYGWDDAGRDAAEFGDWTLHKGQQFLDVLRQMAGIDAAPEPFPIDMTPTEEDARRQYLEGQDPEPVRPVPEGKITAPGTVTDFLIPDFIERPARSVYDWFADERTQRSLDAGGGTMVATVDKFAANAAMVGRYAKDFVLEQTGLPRNAQSDQDWLEFEQGMREHGDKAMRWAMARRVAEGERNVGDALVEAIPQLPAMLAGFGGAGALLGPVGGFAAIEALLAADEGPEAALKGAIKGAVMGKLFEWSHVLSRPLRIPALGAMGAGVTAMEGGSDADIAAQAILFPALGIAGRSGPIGTRYLREHGVMPDLRDAGAHVRDLFLGGNKKTAQSDFDTASDLLTALRKKQESERQDEQARYIVEESAAKELKQGETQADVDARLARIKAAHEENVREMMRRHTNEETPLRQEFELAERRLKRAQDPFRISWQVAPYMRALHGKERQVLVEHERGWREIQAANAAAAERLQVAKDEAKALREREAATPEEAQKNRDLADHLELEGGRITYEMRRQVEDAVDARLLKLEGDADRARFDLADIIAKGNKIDGRRAMWLAADRARQVAYMAGIRAVKAGEGRARALLELGDQHVAQARRKLAERGITEDIKTKEEFDRLMTEAMEMRETYKDLASMELLDAQYRADSRVSRIEYIFGKAVEDARLAGVPASELPRLRAAKGETKPEDAKKRSTEDDWDLPDEDGSGRRGIDYEHAYRRALEGSRDDPVLGEIAKNIDPILERIQNPADVLPAIARIAKQLGHDPASRRGKQTGAMREVLAEKLGMTEKEFLSSPYGKAFSDYEIEAALMLLDKAWTRVRRAYAEYQKDPGSSVAYQRVNLEIMRLIMIRDRLLGAASEAGRALRMFREVKEKFGSITTPLSDHQLHLIINGGSKRLPIAKKLVNGDYTSALVEFYINSLLSGPQTFFVNLYSGAIMLTWRPAQMLIAATLGKARALTRRGAERWHEGDAVHFGEVGAYFRGVMEGFMPGIVQFAKTMFGGTKFLSESNFDRQFTPAIPGLFGKVVRTPGRVLASLDDFFKVMAYRGALRSAAYREAVAERANVGRGDGMAGFRKRQEAIRKRYEELVKNPSATVSARARREALEATFQQPVSGKGAAAFGKLLESTPILKVLVPFHRVLLNGLEMVLSGTPAGPLIYRRVRANLLGMNGKAAQEMQTAHMLMVTGMALWIYNWALSGNVRPGGQDPKDRTINNIVGTPPLSMRIPGTNEWVTLNRVDPLGGIVALGVAAAEASKNNRRAGYLKNGERALSILVGSIATMSLDRAGMAGFVDFWDAVRGGQYGTDTDSMEKWANNLIATLTVPQAVATSSRTFDPYLRRAETMMEKIKNRRPDRYELPPFRNLWGSPIKGYDSYGSGGPIVSNFVPIPLNELMDLTQPFYWGKASKDPATKLIVMLHGVYGWAPEPPDPSIEGRRLLPEERDFFEMQAGRHSYDRIRRLADSQEYQRLQALDAEMRQLRADMGSGEETSRPEYILKQRRMKEVREEARKLRLAIFNKAKDEISAGRKLARQDTRARFPGLMEREKRRDYGREDGELPPWLDGLLGLVDGETETDRFSARDRFEGNTTEEERATIDRRDPYGDVQRWNNPPPPQPRPQSRP